MRDDVEVTFARPEELSQIQAVRRETMGGEGVWLGELLDGQFVIAGACAGADGDIHDRRVRCFGEALVEDGVAERFGASLQVGQVRSGLVKNFLLGLYRGLSFLELPDRLALGLQGLQDELIDLRVELREVSSGQRTETHGDTNTR